MGAGSMNGPPFPFGARGVIRICVTPAFQSGIRWTRRRCCCFVAREGIWPERRGRVPRPCWKAIWDRLRDLEVMLGSTCESAVGGSLGKCCDCSVLSWSSSCGCRAYFRHLVAPSLHLLMCFNMVSDNRAMDIICRWKRRSLGGECADVVRRQAGELKVTTMAN